MDVEDEGGVQLGQIVKASKERFTYEYDFGDGWQHVLLVEKVLTPEPNAQYPVVLTGKRACPPEDVGGIWGYRRVLAVLADPTDPEYETWVEWMGDAFDPEAFDVDATNRALRGH